MKGNTSRKSFYDPETKEIYDNIHLKLSFDELFDDPYYYNSDEIINYTEEEKQIRKDREFLGQSALDLRYQKKIKGNNGENGEGKNKYGSNSIDGKNKSTFISLFIETLGDPIIKILLIALFIKVIFLFKDFDYLKEFIKLISKHTNNLNHYHFNSSFNI